MEIFTAASATIAGATKAISGILKTSRNVEINKAIAGVLDSLVDVQAKLLSAQSNYDALARVKRELEQKIVDYEKWDSEAARYEFKEWASGIFVYELKKDHASGEPIHRLCPNCFQQHKKSILVKPNVSRLNYKCHHCQFEVIPTATQLPVNYGSSGPTLGRPRGF
jgi:hypothetical protein